MRITARSRAIVILVAVLLLGLAAFVLGHQGGGSSGNSSGRQHTTAAQGRSGATSTTQAGRASGSRDAASGLPVVALGSLPTQAADTLRLIRSGGPFPHAQDGIVYHNNNHALPARPDGYYHEYTVTTPGSKNRGARRIIHGGSGDEFYYTGDHYASFQRIA